MRYLTVDRAKPGMLLGADVYDSNGRVLISRDKELTTQYIERLIELGVLAIYIDDDYSKGIDLEPAISPLLRSEGLSAVKNKDIDSCRLISKRIVEEMLKNGFLTLDMADLRTFDDYTFAHSVNVAVLSCTIGININLNEDQLVDLVFASLLHDIGKTELPQDVVNKPGKLTREEYALVKTHPEKSYQLIYDRLDISSMVKNAVLCHHENHDGSGYPKGISEYEISLLARIIHVTDVYDALTSFRPYKQPYSPFAAIEIISGARGTMFDPVMVDTFIRAVPIYPKGTEVILSNGVKGLVVENSGDHNLRPIIRTEEMEELDLFSEEYKDLPIVSPSSQDYLDTLTEEEKRKAMLKPIPRYKITVVDKIGESYEQIQGSLSYLYDFRHVYNETLAEGYIRKYGIPDMMIIDIDGYTFEELKERMEQGKRAVLALPVLVLGSYRDVKTIQLLRRIGIQNYILKPFTTIYLQSEIRLKLNIDVY